MTSLTLEEIEKDPFLKPFTQATFDVSNHVTSLLSTTSSALTQLSTCIASVDQQIHVNVSSHHGDLLAQTSNVELMESVVQNCNKRANTSLRSVSVVRDKLNEQYKECARQVEYMENLYVANQAVRRIKAVIEIDKRVGVEKNTADVATCVAQIEYLCRLSPKMDLLNLYYEKASSLRQNIEKQTENMLNQGLIAGSASQVTSSLQVFANLDVLESKVIKIFSDLEKYIEKDVKTALEVKLETPAARGAAGPGRAILPSTSKAIGQIWSNLDGLIVKVVSQTAKVKLLWKLVTTGKDSCSNLLFIEFIDSGDITWTKFWNNFMDILIRSFSSVKLEFVKAAFENEFPRLLEIFGSLGAKIEEGYPNLSVQSGLRGVLSNYEKAYLSKSLARLFDSVNQNLSAIPSNAGIDAVVKVMKNELAVKDPILKKLVSRNITKTVKLVGVKAEQLVSNDGNSTQVIGPATESQIANAQLLNVLDYFRFELPESAEPIDIVMQNCINPLIQAVADAIEAIVLTMHNENFQRTSRATEYSLYIGELQSFLSRVSKDYFSLLRCSDLVQKCGITLASRTIELFVRHVCLLQTLGQESTKSQLLIDLNHLEIVLTPVCPILSELGRPYKLLKGFRTLLGLKMEEIATSNLVGSVVTYSLTIHLLFRFSNGEMKMPHQNNAWSITRYSKWLDEHPSENDRLTLLKATLESYVLSVKYKGLQEFTAVYPHMLSLLQKGMLG